MKQHKLIAVICLFAFSFTLPAEAEDQLNLHIKVHADRGRDLGQNFGTLFEATSSDGKLVIGAGFQNLYNTRYRADRHAIEFYVRPTSSKRTFETKKLPRPNTLCGTYLTSRDGTVYSTYGGLKSWNAATSSWQPANAAGGTNETMRVGNGTLVFGDSAVKYNGKTILNPPEQGSYQLFFYANGHLCFYHVNKGDRGYREYESDEQGFSKLYACPWTTDQPTVDLSKAIVLTLPIVGETTFAWGQLGDQIVTGSNIGGFYVFEKGRWKILLEPSLKYSYQLYSSMAYGDRLLMGQYPTGQLFEYDGKKISQIDNWPPKLKGVSGSSREAQTTVIYGGDLFVGVWPWGEVWRYNPDSDKWTFMQRMFDHPSLSDKITHPYDVENQNNAVSNQWGQRVTSLVTNGPNLIISTSAKWPCVWNAEKFPFLAPEKWKSYGTVYQMTMPGHLSASSKWTDGPTRFDFKITGSKIEILQDSKPLAFTTVSGSLAKSLSHLKKLNNAKWGDGIYGKFTGKSIKAEIKTN